MTQERIRIVLVDDHPVVRDGLEGQIETQPDLTVVGQAGTGQDGVDVVAATAPDLVITDLRMPGGTGLELIAELQSQHPDLPLMVLSTYSSPDEVTAALAAGATSYLLKDSTRHELFGAIRATAAGTSVLSPALRGLLRAALSTPPPDTDRGADPISPREREILALLADGHTNREIGRALHISEATVKTHLARLYPKLEVADRAAAVAVAYRRGWIR